MKYSRLLIFGGTGTLGTALIKEWKDIVGEYIIFSRDENKHWKLKSSLSNEMSVGNIRLTSVLGDVGEYKDVENVILKHMPTHIIHMAAMKHVNFCETFPERCIKTNVHGLTNILNVISSNEHLKNVKIVNISTDKACSPINIYGLSKSMAERIAMASKCNVTTVRYGNVLNSSGSVIPIFKEKCMRKEVLTVSHPEMTRFIIHISEALLLIEDAMDSKERGNVLIPHLYSMRIKELADVFSERYGVPIQITKETPGEKIHEVLINQYELPHTTYDKTKYISILHRPDFYIPKEERVEMRSSLPQEISSANSLIEKDVLRHVLFEYMKGGDVVTSPPLIVLFGSQGLLGSWVRKYLIKQGITFVSINRDKFEIVRDDDTYSIRMKMQKVVNDVIDNVYQHTSLQKGIEGNVYNKHVPKIAIINCIGITNKYSVSERYMSLVNCVFPYVLNEYGAKCSVPIIHPSTDCVFTGGNVSIPSDYSEYDVPNATDLYGKYKGIADIICKWNTCIRASVIGTNENKKDGFVEWVFESVKNKHVMKGRSGMMWNGVTCLEWAKVALKCILLPIHGVVHISPPYILSKLSMIRSILSLYNMEGQVTSDNTIFPDRTLGNKRGIIHYCPSFEKQIEEMRDFPNKTLSLFV